MTDMDSRVFYSPGDIVTLTIFRTENVLFSNSKTFDVNITLIADE